MMIGFLVGTQEVHVILSSTSFPAAAQWDGIDFGNDKKKKRISTDVEVASGNLYCRGGLDCYRQVVYKKFTIVLIGLLLYAVLLTILVNYLLIKWKFEQLIYFE